MHMDMVPPPTPSLTRLTIGFVTVSAVMIALLLAAGTGVDLIAW
jgi:hypothetical protein